MIDSKVIKEMAYKKGATICGIATTEWFIDAPKGFHPCDIYADCQSVVVFESRFRSSTLLAGTNAPYTFVRNCMVAKLDGISFQLSDELEKKGVVSVPIPSVDPYDYWEPDQNHGRGILSLKHAGWLAGIGKLGKNTLLLNQAYGSMIWLVAVLVSVELEPNPIPDNEVCIPEYTLCLDACP